MPRPALTSEEITRTRGALLDVAQGLYEADGIEGMSFRSIAAAYGCSPTMPYKYFASKAALVDGLRVRSYEWLRGILVAAASDEPAPLEALHRLAEAYVHAAIDRPRMYDLLYTADGAWPETEPALFEAKLAAIGVCQGVIEAASQAGQLELATDPETAAHLFWVGAHGLVSLSLGGFLVVGRTVDDLLAPLIATLVAGLKEMPS